MGPSSPIWQPVASSFAIDFIAPAREGDLLTARCFEVSKAGRTGVYDTEITNQRGERVAHVADHHGVASRHAEPCVRAVNLIDEGVAKAEHARQLAVASQYV